MVMVIYHQQLRGLWLFKKNNELNIVVVEEEEADMTECVTDRSQETSISSQ